jgi:hypothetical protein
MKVICGLTYYYEDFITVDEQLFLRDWALRNEEYLIPNPSGPYRKRVVLNKIPEYPNVLNDLKDRLIRLENISNSENIITNGEQDIVSLQRNMGVVPEHTDYDRIEGYYLRRYNIFISLPEKGGLPVYGGEIINVKERCVLKVDAGLIPHSTTIINGETPRIMLSYGFNIKRI